MLVSLTVKLVLIHLMLHLTNLIKEVGFYLMVRLLLVVTVLITIIIQILIHIHSMLHLKGQVHTQWKFYSEVLQLHLVVGPLALTEVMIWQ